MNAAARFWEAIEPEPNSGCWLWARSTTPGGYGKIGVKARRRQAHRFAYELLVGPIPVGLQLDHLCRVRSCVNPRHLELVTQRENVLRGVGPSAVAARSVLCANGHPLDRRRPGAERYCSICVNAKNRERNRRWRARRAQNRAAPEEPQAVKSEQP